MTIRAITVSLIIAAASTSSMLAAESADTLRWSYADCVAYAKANNISLRQSELSLESTKASLEAARAQWAPSLDFATTQSFANKPFGQDTKNSYNSSYGLNAGWTVWDGGKRENNIRREQKQTEIDANNTEDIFRSIETDLLGVYINILYAREAININREAATVSAAQAERARKLMEAGRLSRVDYAQLQSQARQDEYNVVNAQGNYDTYCTQLKQLLEIGIGKQIEPISVNWTAEDVTAAYPSLDESYALALSTDAKLEANKLEIESAELDTKIARAGYYPSVNLNAGIGTGYYAPGESFGNQMKWGLNESVGLTVSVPILDNKKTKTAVTQANIQRINAVLEEEARRNEIARTVEGCYIDLKTAIAQYEAGVDQVAAAKLSNELVSEQFNLGLVNTVELMQAHNTLLQTQSELLQSKYKAMLNRKLIEFYRTATVSIP
jgi:outer membrane protein